MNMEEQGIEAYRAEMLATIAPHRPCKDAVDELNACTTVEEVANVVMRYQSWLAARGIDCGPLPAGLTSMGHTYLHGYAHPLPAGLTSMGSTYGLGGYAHPLPAGLTSMGDADLCDYAHPLPAGLTSMRHADLRGYAHPLPAGLKKN